MNESTGNRLSRAASAILAEDVSTKQENIPQEAPASSVLLQKLPPTRSLLRPSIAGQSVPQEEPRYPRTTQLKPPAPSADPPSDASSSYTDSETSTSESEETHRRPGGRFTYDESDESGSTDSEGSETASREEDVPRRASQKTEHVVIALYDLQNPPEETLKFQKGDQFQVLSRTENGWYNVQTFEKEPRVGYIPISYVEV